MSTSRRWAVIGSMLALAAYFCVTAAPGLQAYFTMDDGGNLVNLHGYWKHSLLGQVALAAKVVTGAYRPLGGVFYFVLYKLAGYNPLPFRAVCLAFMLANVVLTFALLLRLAGSLRAAMLGAVLFANHPVVLELLYSSGTIYEILCFFFYFAAVGCYFVWRQAGPLSWRRLAVVLVLAGCALDSKEMAMTLPGALLLLELICFPPLSWSWPRARGVLLTAALVIPTIAVKVLTTNPLSNDPRYHHHSLPVLLSNLRAYHHFLLYGALTEEGFPLFALLLLWTLMAATAISFRSRPMAFGLAFLIVGLLPVALIPPRGGYMLYVPLFGWCLYTGTLVQRLIDDLVRGLKSARTVTAIRVAATVVCTVLIANTHAAELAPVAVVTRRHQSETKRILDRLRQVHPKLPAGSTILLLDDPAEAGFEILFLAQMAYADPTLQLDRIKMVTSPPDLTRYDFILAGGWDFRNVRSPSDARPPVRVQVHPSDGGISVKIPEFAGQSLALRTRDGHEFRCTLDAHGRALLPAQDPAMKIRCLRTEGSGWMTAATE